MQFRRTLPGAGSTDFYLTDPENGGLSIEQQEYAADLIMAYRRKYPDLKINAVWENTAYLRITETTLFTMLKC